MIFRGISILLTIFPVCQVTPESPGQFSASGSESESIITEPAFFKKPINQAVRECRIPEMPKFDFRMSNVERCKGVARTVCSGHRQHFLQLKTHIPPPTVSGEASTPEACPLIAPGERQRTWGREYHDTSQALEGRQKIQDIHPFKHLLP